jgi:hypothetical protein
MSIDHQAILFEMEAIKTRYSSRRRTLLCRLFGRLKGHDRDQAHDSHEATKNNVRARRNLNIEKYGRGTTKKESANLDALLAKSSSNRVFLVPCTMLYDLDRDSNAGSQEEYHSRNGETSTDQEISQNTIGSPRRMYPPFDQEDEHGLVDRHQSYATLPSLYSYRDSDSTDSHGYDLSICQSMSMSSIGGSSIISDLTSVNWWISSKGGRLIGEF